MLLLGSRARNYASALDPICSEEHPSYGWLYDKRHHRSTIRKSEMEVLGIGIAVTIRGESGYYNILNFNFK